MNQKVKVKGEGEERTAKPKMTAEQKACLAACKSLDADVERAQEITACSDYVLHELCKSCKNAKECKKLKGLPMINCRMAAIASVIIGTKKPERNEHPVFGCGMLNHGYIEWMRRQAASMAASMAAKQEGGAK